MADWSSKGGNEEATAAGGAMLLRESVVELEQGSVLAGRYQIRRVLGKGATGVVLEADDRVSRSLVALKVFKPEIASNDRWQEIVGSELRHARQIMHPNVCRVFDAGEADGYRFLSMEYASGGSLRQRLKDADPNRTFDERVDDARAVVNGLAAIHAAGLIHRDVKPDNVLLMEDGRLVLTDFGLAVAPGQTTFVSGYSGAVGTPSYMAPEVALGGDASMASDVFSLGVILHEVFFGKRPEWEVSKRGRFLRSRVSRQSPRRLRLIARLCADCLEELAPRRLQSALEVRRQFERATQRPYGSVLGALRAARWGLAIGLPLALAAAGAVYLATRPSDVAQRLKIVGTPVELPRSARLIATRPGRMRCMSVSPDGNTLRVVWGTPPVPAEIDVRTNAVTPWNILPETYPGLGCPELSPDGKRLAFTSGNSVRQVMLASNPEGRDARVVTSGSAPQWLPSGQELVYVFDDRRAGVVSIGQAPRLLPEANGVDEMLMSISISAAGDRLASVFGKAPAATESLIVVHSFPSLTILEKHRMPAPATTARPALAGRGLDLLADEAGGYELFRVDSGVARRVARMAESEIVHVSRGPRLFLGTERRRASLFVAVPSGEEHDVAQGRAFGRRSVSADGEILAEQELFDGRTIVGLYDPRPGRFRALTEGPLDRDPLFRPGGTGFAFIDQRARILLCDRQDRMTCRTMIGTDEAFWLAGFSPDGDQLAYLSLTGATLRLRLVSVAGGLVRDLGVSSNRCRIRWRDDDTIWIFDSSDNQRLWVEMDVVRFNPTGRTEPANAPGSDGCPVDEPDASHRVQAWTESSLWNWDDEAR